MDGDPAPTVKRVKATLRIYPLAAAASPPALTFVNGSGRSFNTISAAGFSVFEAINDVVVVRSDVAAGGDRTGGLSG